MKDEALGLARTTQDPGTKLNLLREYVQAFTLRSLSESEAFNLLSFVGGTALRFLFDLPRFSEDLDFSLERREGYEPTKWLKRIEREMTLSGFNVDIRWDEDRVVHAAWIRFSGLMQDANLTNDPRQKLSIKLEIDTRPPQGAGLVKRVINRHMLFALQHHDLPSLMAGKLHALLTRPYTKGRDWYDLLWYRSRSAPVEPNLTLLDNALKQTEEHPPDPSTWRELLREKMESIDEKRLVDDVRPFLERRQDAALMTPAHLKSLLEM